MLETSRKPKLPVYKFTAVYKLYLFTIFTLIKTSLLHHHSSVNIFWRIPNQVQIWVGSSPPCLKSVVNPARLAFVVVSPVSDSVRSPFESGQAELRNTVWTCLDLRKVRGRRSSTRVKGDVWPTGLDSREGGSVLSIVPLWKKDCASGWGDP